MIDLNKLEKRKAAFYYTEPHYLELANKLEEVGFTRSGVFYIMDRTKIFLGPGRVIVEYLYKGSTIPMLEPENLTESGRLALSVIANECKINSSRGELHRKGLLIPLDNLKSIADKVE